MHIRNTLFFVTKRRPSAKETFLRNLNRSAQEHSVSWYLVLCVTRVARTVPNSSTSCFGDGTQKARTNNAEANDATHITDNCSSDEETLCPGRPCWKNDWQSRGTLWSKSCSWLVWWQVHVSLRRVSGL